MNFLDFEPITNSLLACGLLGLGIINTLFMAFLMGRAVPSKHPGFLRKAHRITGYIFLALYLFIGAIMFKKLGGFTMLPPKATVHAYIGIIIFPLVILKICTNRFFKRFYSRLSMYGIMILIAVYLQIPLHAGVYIYSAIKSKYVSTVEFDPSLLNDSETLHVNYYLDKVLAGQRTKQSKSEIYTISQNPSSASSYKKWDDDISILCE